MAMTVNTSSSLWTAERDNLKRSLVYEEILEVGAATLDTLLKATSSHVFAATWDDVSSDNSAGNNHGGHSIWMQYLHSSDNASAATTANDSSSRNSTSTSDNESYSIPHIILIAIVAGFLSIVTVVGNFMVLISFKMDKQLQTISNYFLLSLAVADFVIGLISMPLFTVYLLLKYWPLGPFICDTWLSLDYLASNASVLNLLIISFDRYFSVTRPLTYRARRTTRRAIFMISSAWIISLILWPPWVYSWPYIEGKRTVPPGLCYIQFLETNVYVTAGTAFAAFYIPVTVMCGLYWKIWMETKKRQKDLTNLQAGKKDNSKRSTSSDDAAVAAVVSEDMQVPHRRSRSDSTAPTAMLSVVAAGSGKSEDDNGDIEIETTYVPTAMCIETQRYMRSGGGSGSGGGMGIIGGGGGNHQHTRMMTRSRVVAFVISWIRRHCHLDRDGGASCEYSTTSGGGGGGDEDSTSDGGGPHGSPGNATPASVETPVQSSMSRCTSLTLRLDPYVIGPAVIPQAAAAVAPRMPRIETMIPLLERSAVGNGARAGSRPPLQTRSQSADSVYTIMIRLPTENSVDGETQPSIKMIAEENGAGELSVAETGMYPNVRPSPPTSITSAARTAASASCWGELSLHPESGAGVIEASGATPSPLRRVSQPPDSIKLPLSTKLVPKQAMTKAAKKKKKKTQERKQDRKAAKTLSAILLAFIITWTPYNVLVLIRMLTGCAQDCIPEELWNFSYYLCYINSTVNPLCYALCNAAFRRTYVRILTCKWHTKRRNQNRCFYS